MRHHDFTHDDLPSIPSRESRLLRQSPGRRIGCEQSRFNPFQGISPSAARLARPAALLRGDVSIPSRESRLLRLKPREYSASYLRSFNPFQGISPSAAPCATTISPTTISLQSLPGNLAFCGRARADELDASNHVSIPSRESRLLRRDSPARLRCSVVMFQSLPGNLAFCG